MDLIGEKLKECREKRAQGMTALIQVERQEQELTVAIHQLDGMIMAYEAMEKEFTGQGALPTLE